MLVAAERVDGTASACSKTSLASICGTAGGLAIVATTGTAGGAAGLLATTGAIVLVVVAVTVQAGGLLRPAEVLVDAVGEGGCCFFLTASLKHTEHMPSVDGLP